MSTLRNTTPDRGREHYAALGQLSGAARRVRRAQLDAIMAIVSADPANLADALLGQAVRAENTKSVERRRALRVIDRAAS
jgi:hypothetical protein